jgi:hypothetical protein
VSQFIIHERSDPMTITQVLLWPGTKLCERLGVDPEADAGMIRWMFNTLFYLVVGLIIAWIVVV